MSTTTTVVRRPARRYACARCGRHQTADHMVFSQWTRQRYCADLAGCGRRAKRRQQRDPRLA